MIYIEQWKKVFEGEIPKEKYEMLLQNGEKEGLVITLLAPEYNVIINFGVVSAVRILDEGIVLNGLFNEEQTREFQNFGFDNTIYQVISGEFENFARKISGELYDYFNLKHYVVISLNFIVEIITEWEPNISIIKNCR